MVIKRTGYDIIVNVLCILLLVGIFIYLGLRWDSISDKIPGHYNAAGIVDRWGYKSELLITPIVGLIMYVGLTVIENYPQIWNTGVEITEHNKTRVYRILKNLIGTLKLLMVAMFTFMTFNSSLSKGLPIWFLPISLILIFGFLIFFIVKLVKAR